MPTFHIYHAGTKVGSKDFRDRFYIIKELDRDEFRWEADEEQGRSKEGGVIHIWILGASSSPIISFVRSDWHLTIDGFDFAERLYENVEVSGKTVELQYGAYCFLCKFPPA